MTTGVKWQIHRASCSASVTNATCGTQQVIHRARSTNSLASPRVSDLTDAHVLRAEHHVVGMGIGGGTGAWLLRDGRHADTPLTTVFKQQNAVLTLPIQLSSYASQYTLDHNIASCSTPLNTRAMAAAAAQHKATTQHNHDCDDNGHLDTQEARRAHTHQVAPAHTHTLSKQTTHPSSCWVLPRASRPSIHTGRGGSMALLEACSDARDTPARAQLPTLCQPAPVSCRRGYGVAVASTRAGVGARGRAPKGCDVAAQVPGVLRPHPQ